MGGIRGGGGKRPEVPTGAKAEALNTRVVGERPGDAGNAGVPVKDVLGGLIVVADFEIPVHVDRRLPHQHWQRARKPKEYRDPATEGRAGRPRATDDGGLQGLTSCIQKGRGSLKPSHSRGPFSPVAADRLCE